MDSSEHEVVDRNLKNIQLVSVNSGKLWGRKQTISLFAAILTGVVAITLVIVILTGYTAPTTQEAYFYTFGGWPFPKVTYVYQITDKTTINQITNNTDLLMGVEYTGSTTQRNWICLVGGQTNGRKSIIYDTNASSFISLPILRTKHPYNPGVFILNSTLYAVGGYDSVMEYIDITDYTSRWKIHDVSLPFDVYHSGVVTIGSCAYLAGGFSSTAGGKLASLFLWKVGNRNFTRLSDMQEKRWKHCVVESQGKVWVIAGYAGENQYLSSVEVYDPVFKTWHYKSPIPQEMSSMGCFQHHGFIFVTGGRNSHDQSLDTVYMYNTDDDTWQLSPTRLTHPVQDHVAEVINGSWVYKTNN